MGVDVARTLSLSLARVIEPTLTNSQSSITSLDVDGTGELVVAAVDDDSLRIMSLDKGAESHTVLAKSVGCSLARFTHHKNAVIFASTKSQSTANQTFTHSTESNYAIQYLSVYDDRYLRHFHGHTSQLRSLSMSPVDDSFMSAAGSGDNTVRFWDLRSNQSSRRVEIPTLITDNQSTEPAPLACYDPQGLIFAVASHSTAIRLFDIRSTASGPFTTFNLDRPISAPSGISSQFTVLKFSPDGQTLLVGSNLSKLSLIDAYEGQIKQKFESISTSKSSQLDATFTSDGQYILAGSEDGKVFVHRATDQIENPLDIEAGRQNQSAGIPKEPVLTWHAHTKPVRAITASHTRACVVTAAHEFGLWLPRPD